ncbi:MAG TPA: hypothetical protein PK597_01440, partial [Oscillospiraceae bacterium]|nr:hypothetical protein [Oscillospiraceae bacterium]
MASDQTASLGLCQWAADDPVLRADFNADNQKLDAAAGSMALVRLMSVTTAAAANTIELDLTGIDLTQFDELQLRVRQVQFDGICR